MTSSLTRHQRHELAAVLHQMAAVRELDLLGVDLLEPRDQRQRHRLRLRRAGAEHEQRHRSARSVVTRSRSASRCVRCRAVAAAPIAWAMPFGSMIMITEPSPRMVLPENIAMWRSLRRHRLDHDFLGVEHAVDHDAEGLRCRPASPR